MADEKERINPYESPKVRPARLRLFVHGARLRWITGLALLLVCASLVCLHTNDVGFGWFGWPFVYRREYLPAVPSNNPFPELDRFSNFIINPALDLLVAVILFGAVVAVFKLMHGQRGRFGFCLHLGFIFIFVVASAMIPAWFENSYLGALGYRPWIVQTPVVFSILCLLYLCLWSMVVLIGLFFRILVKPANKD